ncbi:MAG: hypothetical protein IKU32_04070 [Clostridia bacterium]|nr:hypothetical protein [Clostridia bacterium]
MRIIFVEGNDSAVYAVHMIMADRQRGGQDSFCSVCTVMASITHRITIHRAV